MARLLNIENLVDGDLTDAYLVTLESEDGTYGAKTLGGIVIVPPATPTVNSSTGVYEYEIVEPNDTYLVSWKIIQEITDDPTYIVQTITPLQTNTEIQAVTENIGKFAVGSTATLTILITNFEGQAIDPYEISIRITDQSGIDVTLENPLPDRIKTGFYVFEWPILSNQSTGIYNIVWSYSFVGQPTSQLEQSVTLIKQGNSSALYSGRLGDLRAALESLICCTQRIPVYFEQSKPSFDRKTFTFSFKNWNAGAGIKIYRNKTALVTSGLLIDYPNGQIIFDKPLTAYDIINVDYNFRWFTVEQLDFYILNAINVYNSFPPQTGYNVSTVPTWAIPAVLYKAAADAIREMIMCLMFQEPQQVFGGSEEAARIRSDLETLKKNYEGDWRLLMEQKKLGRYPQTRAISVPEYTLPGGRSRWFRYLFSTNAG
jgi:hypothetical protein